MLLKTEGFQEKLKSDTRIELREEGGTLKFHHNKNTGLIYKEICLQFYLGVKKIDGPVWIINRFLACSLEVLASCQQLDVVADILSSLLEVFTSLISVSLYSSFLTCFLRANLN